MRQEVELPPGLDAKLFGAVPGTLALAGIIERAGFAKTTRPVAHARPVTDWQLTDRAAAVAWLAEHPPPGTTQLPLPLDDTKKDPAVAAAGPSA